MKLVEGQALKNLDKDKCKGCWFKGKIFFQEYAHTMCDFI